MSKADTHTAQALLIDQIQLTKIKVCDPRCGLDLQTVHVQKDLTDSKELVMELILCASRYTLDRLFFPFLMCMRE